MPEPKKRTRVPVPIDAQIRRLLAGAMYPRQIEPILADFVAKGTITPEEAARYEAEYSIKMLPYSDDVKQWLSDWTTPDDLADRLNSISLDEDTKANIYDWMMVTARGGKALEPSQRPEFTLRESRGRTTTQLAKIRQQSEANQRQTEANQVRDILSGYAGYTEQDAAALMNMPDVERNAFLNSLPTIQG